MDVDSVIEMNDKNAIVPIASPSLARRESFVAMDGKDEKAMVRFIYRPRYRWGVLGRTTILISIGVA